MYGGSSLVLQSPKAHLVATDLLSVYGANSFVGGSDAFTSIKAATVLDLSGTQKLLMSTGSSGVSSIYTGSVLTQTGSASLYASTFWDVAAADYASLYGANSLYLVSPRAYVAATDYASVYGANSLYLASPQAYVTASDYASVFGTKSVHLTSPALASV